MKEKDRVLVIDDEESIRFTFESFLSEEGYEVTTAGDYGEALSRVDGAEYDLIFADIILGGKTGIDFLRHIRQRNMGCPVIMITGVPSLDTAAEAVRLGAFDYIPKPVRQETLVRVARMALSHKRLSDEKEKYRSNLEAIFRSVRDAIITVDGEMNVLEVNDAAANICGFSRAAIGKKFAALPNHCGGRCAEALSETISGKRPVELYRFECSRKGRPAQVVNITASPLVGHSGAFLGAVLVVRDETRVADLETALGERRQFHNIIGKSGKMQEVYFMLDALADVQTTVLITGESGTGKELVADALHFGGVRNGKPIVRVNCSALPENLLESELFGHVRGAFTGAIKDKMGRFERADGGTIFLDEIGDISPAMQLRLLRVLQNMEFERVGDLNPIKVDVRVIAATNRDLAEKVRQGGFREDLFYRLKVVKLNLPSLRERLEDIPLLVDYFVKKFNKKFGKDISGVSSDVLDIFMDYGWPGNVRELEHAIEHAFILCRQPIITVDSLPAEMRGAAAKPDSEDDDPEQIRRALEKSGWNMTEAARLLGISRRTIYRKVEAHGINKPSRK